MILSVILLHDEVIVDVQKSCSRCKLLTAVRKYPRELSCSNPPLSPQVHALVLSGMCQRTTHTAYLTECCETRFDDCSDVSTHGDICVNVDPSVRSGSTDVSPTRTGPVGIWCWRRADKHQSTSVLGELSCNRLDINRYAIRCLLTKRSSSLDSTERFEIGRCDFGSDESKSAFFRMGAVYADFILDWTTPCSRDQQNNQHKNGAATSVEAGVRQALLVRQSQHHLDDISLCAVL